MLNYKLVYDHPYWVNAVDNDDYMTTVRCSVIIEAESEEEAIKKAETLMAQPTGGKWYPRMNEPEQDLLNQPILLIREIKVWDK